MPCKVWVPFKNAHPNTAFDWSIKGRVDPRKQRSYVTYVGVCRERTRRRKAASEPALFSQEHLDLNPETGNTRHTLHQFFPPSSNEALR